MGKQYYDDVKQPFHIPVWAGYGNDGNDQRAHMHVNPYGSYYRSDGLKGQRCSAPLDMDDMCSDPPKQLDLYDIECCIPKGVIRHALESAFIEVMATQGGPGSPKAAEIHEYLKDLERPHVRQIRLD